MNKETLENQRLQEARAKQVPWRKWGPYVSDRQWGTVREDYSQSGDAWNYLSHDQARSRAYRWGEDGIAGFSDEDLTLCFALALWNGRDPILKERLFGLTNSEGNHGEDVKEYYYYLDSTPTHSYMRMLYKYPQAAFPYDDLLRVNRQRGRHDMEYELIDTGIFKEDRYFDVFVEYAKADPEDILIRISVTNRGPERQTLHVLPHLWFRNSDWDKAGEPVPDLAQRDPINGAAIITATHWDLGQRHLYCEKPRELLFTNNETNTQRNFGIPNKTPYVKDGINNYIVHGETTAVNPERRGTKAAAHYEVSIGPGETQVIRLRLNAHLPARAEKIFGAAFDTIFKQRQQEADEFYAALTPQSVSNDAAEVMRQAFAGLLWTKQTYIYEVNRWLKERGGSATRNDAWFHMVNRDVISMPDKWEYPWFAAWDLAFHTLPFAMIDPDFALQQLELMLRERYMHPNGQMPAYEWNFGDVNPPVHPWATLFTYRLTKGVVGDRATEVLKSGFHKLMLNFTWWVNRKDRYGRNIFEGGFLGLDNIGVFDRSSPLPTGGYIEQADGTAWMAFFAQNMLEMALELSMQDPIYEDLAVKFYEHFLWIASAMCDVGSAHDSMWDEEDGFYYDVLRLPDGSATRLKVRSIVGLLPLCAVTVYPLDVLRQLPEFASRATWFAKQHPDLAAGIHPPGRKGEHGRHMLALLDEERLRRVLARMLDPNEFLSDYGIRSLSRYHRDHPYHFNAGGQDYGVGYLPAESDSGMFGGNSNWRGPIWMPINALLIRSLMQRYSYYGDSFKVECPTGSGKYLTLYEVAIDLINRLTRIFTRNEEGHRPVFGGAEKFQNDPHWRDHILFYEYFHGDNGAGLGASHQTGWTGVIAGLIRLAGLMKPEDIREHGTHAVVRVAGKPEAGAAKKPPVHSTTLHDRISDRAEAPRS